MDTGGWSEPMERYRRAVSAYVLAGSIIFGPVLPGHEVLPKPPEAGSITAVERLLEQEGLHDHRETDSGTTRLVATSSVVVTGAGLPSQDQPRA
jgi:hypothetical protein